MYNNTQASRTPAPPPTRQAGAKPSTPRPTWQPQPGGLSREELRKLVIELIG